MRVQVDKARRDNTTRSIQNTVGGLSFQAADLGDFAILDPNVAHIAWRTRPITIVPPLMIMSKFAMGDSVGKMVES